MAERTAIFNLKVEDGNSAKKVAENEKNLNKFRKSAQDAGKGTQDFSKRLQAVNKVVDSNAFSFREANKLIQDYQTIAIQAGKDSPVGKEAIAKAAQLTDQMGKLRAETNNLANDGKNLQGAMQLSQGVLGGYQAFAGVSAMLGVENETLMQTMVHLQSVQQVSMGLESARKTLEEGTAARRIINIAQTKALTIGTTAYAGAQNLLNLAIGKGSIAMKAFRGALVATGIGAIVVGIGMLITNFDKVIGVVQKARDWFNSLGDGFKTVISILLPFIGLIRLIGAGLEALGIIESSNAKDRRSHAAEQARLASEERKRQRELLQQKIKNLEKERKAIEEKADFEIAKLRAAGKDTVEIERQKMEAVLHSNRQQVDSIEKLVEELRTEMKIKALSGQFVFDEIKQMNELLDKRAELKKSIKETSQDLEIFEITQRKKSTEAYKKQAVDEAKLEQEKENKLAEIRRTAEDFMIQSIEDEGLRKRTALRTQHERERDELKKKYGEDTELIKELEAHQADEVRALQKDLNSKKTEEEAKEAEKEREQNLLKLENDLMQLELDGAETLNKELEIARARRDALLADDTLTAEERNKINLEYAAKEAEIEQKKKDEIDKANKAIIASRQGVADAALNVLGDLASVAKEGSATAKALALAEITATTAMGFVRGLAIAQQGAKATGPLAPFTMPIFYGAQIASVLGAANKARGILGGGGSVSAPSASSAPSAGGSGGSQGGDGSVNTRQDAEGKSTDSKVFVSETDISRTQDRVNQINVRSSF